jgi:Family of unknown function (DUF5996)
MSAASWPELRVDEWQRTRDTVHLWTQIVGKIRLARTPVVNHWWNVTLHVTDRGLTTGLIPGGPAQAFQIDFDFLAHRLEITRADGERRVIALAPRSVADFHRDVMARLDELGLQTPIWSMPVEIPGAVPFETDEGHASYDPDAVTRYWHQLVDAQRVFEDFRSGFVGKVSPVHFFWGAFDLAVTRFSGRPAPPHPGSAPNCGPHVMQEAYSHEVSSAGFWPGGSAEGTFYAYAYPEPDGFSAWRDLPDGASYSDELGEFVLPYAAVRTADDPDGLLGRFLEATYDAAADLADWDRTTLERTGPGARRRV